MFVIGGRNSLYIYCDSLGHTSVKHLKIFLLMKISQLFRLKFMTLFSQFVAIFLLLWPQNEKPSPRILCGLFFLKISEWNQKTWWGKVLKPFFWMLKNFMDLRVRKTRENGERVIMDFVGNTYQKYFFKSFTFFIVFHSPFLFRIVVKMGRREIWNLHTKQTFSFLVSLFLFYPINFQQTCLSSLPNNCLHRVSLQCRKWKIYFPLRRNKWTMKM